MGKSRSRRRKGEISESSMSVSTNSIAQHLPMDLIADILSRLCVKSLSRSKSVSKSWYHLITNPGFIKLHQTFSKTNPNHNFSALLSIHKMKITKEYVFRLNLIDALDKPIDIKLPFMSKKRFSFLGMSNGLVCLMLHNKSSDIIVCNPTTGKFRKIPPFDDSPIIQEHIFSGFTSNEDGYELIRIDYTSISGLKINSFSSGTNIWKDIKVKMGKCETHDDPTMGPLRNDCIPIFRNGIFYWEGEKDDDPDYACVMIFDVSNEEFDEIWAPDEANDHNWELREINEEVVLVGYYINDVDFDMWRLRTDENGKFWEMWQCKPIQDVENEIPDDVQVIVLGSSGVGKLVLRYITGNNAKLCLYDTETGDVNILARVHGGWDYEMHMFAESLALVE